MHHKNITISVALIQNGSSYICLRRDDNHYKDYIEFPGGKLIKNETPSIFQRPKVFPFCKQKTISTYFVLLLFLVLLLLDFFEWQNQKEHINSHTAMASLFEIQI